MHPRVRREHLYGNGVLMKANELICGKFHQLRRVLRTMLGLGVWYVWTWLKAAEIQRPRRALNSWTHSVKLKLNCSTLTLPRKTSEWNGMNHPGITIFRPGIWRCSILYSHHCLCPWGELPLAEKLPKNIAGPSMTKRCFFHSAGETWFQLDLDNLGQIQAHETKTDPTQTEILEKWYLQRFSQCFGFAASLGCWLWESVMLMTYENCLAP